MKYTGGRRARRTISAFALRQSSYSRLRMQNQAFIHEISLERLDGAIERQDGCDGKVDWVRKRLEIFWSANAARMTN